MVLSVHYPDPTVSVIRSVQGISPPTKQSSIQNNDVYTIDIYQLTFYTVIDRKLKEILAVPYRCIDRARGNRMRWYANAVHTLPVSKLCLGYGTVCSWQMTRAWHSFLSSPLNRYVPNSLPEIPHGWMMVVEAAASERSNPVAR